LKTIVIIDDMPAISEPIAVALSHMGFKTICATNGVEALQLCANCEPDLILLDLAMPVMPGLEFLRAFRASPAGKDVPVIILSSRADKSEVASAIKLGISGYLLKSRFSLADLNALINKSLRGQVSSHSNTDSVTRMADGGASRPDEPSAKTIDKPMAQPDAVRSLKPITTRAEMGRLVDDCGELKGFSPAISAVLKLTGTDRCSIEQIAKAISRDHAIALKVLKLANSAVYTRGESIDSVHKAVMRIGIAQIRQAVLNLAVIERFSDQIADGFIESGQFWEHAVATGIIAAEIAHTRSENEADSAFTMGLLHDVGRLVLLNVLGKRYLQVLKVARDLDLPLEQVEHRMLFYSHADIMDKVFRRWSFPKELINPIVFHHLAGANIRSAAPLEAVQIATLALANRLAHSFMLGSSGNQTIYATEELCETLRLESTHVARIESIARDETDKVKIALLANSGQPNWPQLQRVHQQSLVAPLNVLYVSASPGIDAHRIFCDQLSQRDQASAPNLGVVSFRHAREREALTSQFLREEAERGVTNLPLIAISPNGKMMPEKSAIASRRIELLMTPFSIGRFLASANSLLGELRAAA
jgi:HD-like signal output (HDOD) protein/DNA-binding NarL/FixJ family response regulator